MAQCPSDIPWWRVVAKTGKLPVWKRDPALEDEQRERLRSEGVPFLEDMVDLNACLWIP